MMIWIGASLCAISGLVITVCGIRQWWLNRSAVIQRELARVLAEEEELKARQRARKNWKENEAEVRKEVERFVSSGDLNDAIDLLRDSTTGPFDPESRSN